MRTLHVWEDGYCWEPGDNEGDEEDEDTIRERRSMDGEFEAPCPACGQRYSECVCPVEDFDPFSEGEA